jgi:hypothetical protein
MGSALRVGPGRPGGGAEHGGVNGNTQTLGLRGDRAGTNAALRRRGGGAEPHPAIEASAADRRLRRGRRRSADAERRGARHRGQSPAAMEAPASGQVLPRGHRRRTPSGSDLNGRHGHGMEGAAPGRRRGGKPPQSDVDGTATATATKARRPPYGGQHDRTDRSYRTDRTHRTVRRRGAVWSEVVRVCAAGRLYVSWRS